MNEEITMLDPAMNVLLDWAEGNRKQAIQNYLLLSEMDKVGIILTMPAYDMPMFLKILQEDS